MSAGEESGVVLEWPLRERLPEQVATALMGPGAPFETTTEIVNGQQHEVFVNRKRSLREALAAGVASSADLVHVATDAAEFTFADVGRDVASMAAALREQYGVGPGDRVAIASANGYEYLVTFWATVSHRNNLHWAQSVMLHGAARIALGDARPAAGRPVAISAAPMFHVGGLNCQLIPAML